MITKYEGFTKKRDLFKSMQVKLLSREIRLSRIMKNDCKELVAIFYYKIKCVSITKLS